MYRPLYFKVYNKHTGVLIAAFAEESVARGFMVSILPLETRLCERWLDDTKELVGREFERELLNASE